MKAIVVDCRVEYSRGDSVFGDTRGRQASAMPPTSVTCQLTIKCDGEFATWVNKAVTDPDVDIVGLLNSGMSGARQAGRFDAQERAEAERRIASLQQQLEKAMELLRDTPRPVFIPVETTTGGGVPPADLSGRETTKEMRRLLEKEAKVVAAERKAADDRRRAQFPAGISGGPTFIGQPRPPMDMREPAPPAAPAPQKAPLDARMGAIDLGDEPSKP